MAKQPLENPFRKTEGKQPDLTDNSDLDEGRVVTSGVGITQGELRAVDELAKRHEVSRNSLMRLAIRLFIIDARSGAINLEEYFEEPEKPKKRLKFRRSSKL